MKTSSTLLLITVAAIVGCSARVEVETTTAASDPPITSEKTAVEVGFLVDRESEPSPSTASEKSKTVEPAHKPTPPPPTLDPPSHGAEDLRSFESDRRSVTVVENVINVAEKHRHTHYHFYEPPKSRKKPVKVRVEVVQKHERDERCERLRREYEEKTAEWEQMMRQNGQK